MPSVDCWRLLGVSPDATVKEVRAAYLRRVRDVHPDSGGTGDGLTLQLLQDARDEALALIEARGGRRGRARPGAADDGRPGPAAEPEAGDRRCHVCRRELPPSQLARTRVKRGFGGRPAAGEVLMCLPCRLDLEARHARAANTRAILTVAGLLAVLGVALASAMLNG